MEELFEDLSSISDCDDECLLKLSTKKNRSFFIHATSVHLICSMPAAYEPEIEENPTKQKRLEEKSCGTESKNEEKLDKWVQTEETEVDTKMTFAELPPTYREAEYEESALERILRHISAHLHRVQLLQWMSENPERNASFNIRPVQAPNIFQATFNEKMNTFVLLLASGSSLYVELRSLKNLLKSIHREIVHFDKDDRLNLFSQNQFIAVYSSNRIVIMDIQNMSKMQIFETEKIVSIFVLENMIHFINERGIVNKLDLEMQNISKVLTISTLLCPVLSCNVICDQFHIISSKCLSTFVTEKWLDYESYEISDDEKTVLNRGRIIRFGSDHLIFFSRKLQICYIWETEKPKNPSHMLVFSSYEYTVDISCDQENIYSLTNEGLVSIWKLRPNGRKFRDKLYTTLLSNCTKLLMAYPQKFVIQTHNEVHFLVFGIETEKSKTMSN